MKTLGERIAYYRKRRGLTQEQLAEQCSVTPQAVSKWENDLSAPDISLLVPLAELFGISADELLGKEKAQGAEEGAIDLGDYILHIRYIENGETYQINLPLSEAETFVNGGIINFGKGNLKKIDFAKIASCALSGKLGKLVEFEESDGSKGEIWVEG